MRTRIQYISSVSLLLLFFIVLISTGHISYAATDDPGSGRLSGNNIPEEFYDTDIRSDSTSESEQYNVPFLNRYGNSTSISPYTNQTYTHHPVFNGRTISNGIDVSQWQGQIDWNKVKATGIDFALIRVGYRGYGSSGTLNASTKDTFYDTNMTNAIAAGIKVGIYVFSQAITPDEAKEEAQYILDNIGSYNVTMPLVLDYEYASTTSGLGGRLYNAKLSKEDATNICLAFCQTIAEAGYTPMVYANKSMLETQLNASDISSKGYHIWLANYTTNTTYGGTFDFWQYSSTGKVDGITGNVDMNFYYTQNLDNFSQSRFNIASATIASVANQAYTGANIAPDPVITYDNHLLIKDTDYTVSYSNNKNIGIATIKITGKGNYLGSKTTTFKIVPKTVTSLKAKKRTKNDITLSWNKNTSGSGYQIYRSTSLNGTYKKIKTISKNSTTSYKNTKLKAGQCYYYKIRSYKKIGKTTYYGAFTQPTALYTKMEYTRNALTKSGACIYDTPSSSGNVLATPSANVKMSVTYLTKDENGKDWYHVTYETKSTQYKGYILANQVTITKVGKIVKTNKVNLRKSHSTKSKVLTTLKKNQKVTVLTTKNKNGTKWYKVTFTKKKKNYTGWISAPYIKIQ